MSEWNLSEKIGEVYYGIEVDDVKEFIKRLKDKICSASDMETTTIEQIRAFDFCLEEIDKLVGERLK